MNTNRDLGDAFAEHADESHEWAEATFEAAAETFGGDEVVEQRFNRYVDTSAHLLAADLAALLNRAAALRIAVCCDVDRDGFSYSVEWGMRRVVRALDVTWDTDGQTWKVSGGDA